MVEFSTATQEARVRFPASAKLFLFIIVIFGLPLPDIKSLIFFKSLKLLLRSEIERFDKTSRSPLTDVPRQRNSIHSGV